MERFTPEQLLSIFESCLKIGSTPAVYGHLHEAWATLFSKIYLTPEELIERMEAGEHKLGVENERMLCRFIRADCASRGIFVLNVIKKGGMMDRAALIMIADLADIARIEHEGMTALHMLVTACDRRVRPALIRRAGTTLFSTVYDQRDLPPLFLLFGMSDLGTADIDAIEEVFTPDDLKKVKSRSGRGRNALEVFSEIAPSVRKNIGRERNEFSNPYAIKTTHMRPGSGMPAGATVYKAGVAPVPANEPADSPAETGSGGAPDTPATTTSRSPASTGTAETKMKVMIVDDDEIIRNLLQLRLKILGYDDCVMAESGDDAVKLLESVKPDLVFMDIMMPGKLDGIHAAREIKAKTGSRIIFLTGHTDQEILDRAKEVEPEGFIVKPFNDTVLRVTLNFLK